eukprot:479716-Pelagomonas_calceolata.AAC.1
MAETTAQHQPLGLLTPFVCSGVLLLQGLQITKDHPIYLPVSNLSTTERKLSFKPASEYSQKKIKDSACSEHSQKKRKESAVSTVRPSLKPEIEIHRVPQEAQGLHKGVVAAKKFHNTHEINLDIPINHKVPPQCPPVGKSEVIQRESIVIQSYIRVKPPAWACLAQDL